MTGVALWRWDIAAQGAVSSYDRCRSLEVGHHCTGGSYSHMTDVALWRWDIAAQGAVFSYDRCRSLEVGHRCIGGRILI